MSISFVPLPCVLLGASFAKTAPKADFFVAPAGKDTWSGTRPCANSRRSAGPFATVQRAQLAVRELKQREPQRTGAIVVMVRGGNYVLDKPLEFTPDDSGAAGAPVIYAAYPGEQPVFSGGVRLIGWQATQEGRWQLTIPQVQRGDWSFIQLFVNGQRRCRPRLPKEGYYTIAGQLPPAPGAKGFDRFRFNPGDIRGDWSSLNDVEVLGFQNWTMARMRIAAVDEKENVVRFTGDTRGTDSWQSLPKGNRFLVENVREALDQPGEWYLDRKTGLLTYLPMPGEDASAAEVIAPRLESLVLLKGDVTQRRWVEHLQFRGLRFEHSNWTTPPEGNNFPQAEVNLSGAITAIGTRDCLFDGCTITHVGAYAIAFGQGCKSNVVENCSLTDLGAGGVKIGEIGLRDDDEDVTSSHIVRNNLITGGGRLHPAAVGVWIGQSPENLIEHNDIYDFYYTGISVGWTWGYGRSQAHHNTVAWNRVWQIGQGVLSDMGGIYTLGVSPGSVIHHNIFHDIESFSYGGWGIYFDEGTSEMLAENNLVYRTKTGGFHQHYGKQNRVENNIFAFARQDGQIISSRPEEHLSFTFQHNIVFWKDAPLLNPNWSGDTYALDYNLYWETDGKPADFAGMTLEQWRKKGQDAHSLIADPQFVNPDKDDYNLQPDSPAAKVGFKPIDLSAAGLRPAPAQAEQARISLPRAFPRSLTVHGPVSRGWPAARTPFVQTWRVSEFLPRAGCLDGLAYPTDPASLKFRERTFSGRFCDLHAEIGPRAQEDPLLYFACRLECGEPMKLAALFGYDGPVKLWVDRQEKLHDPNGTNPASVDMKSIPFAASAGTHEVLVALGSNDGRAWGIYLRFERLDVPMELLKKEPRAYSIPAIVS